MAQTNRSLARKAERAREQRISAGFMEYSKPAYNAPKNRTPVYGAARPLTCSGATLPPGVTMKAYLKAMF